jgi:spore maturation protein SpmA
MSRPDQHWLAVGFVLLALASITGMALLATGYWQVASEALGLIIGGGLMVVLWLGLRRR